MMLLNLPKPRRPLWLRPPNGFGADTFRSYWPFVKRKAREYCVQPELLKYRRVENQRVLEEPQKNSGRIQESLGASSVSAEIKKETCANKAAALLSTKPCSGCSKHPHA
jgi:hypothetical protein